MLRTVIIPALALTGVVGLCPFGGKDGIALPSGHPIVTGADAPSGFAAALAALDLDAVRTDLKALFLESQEQWPADYGNYAPLFVRLAWHCSGSYRTSDGRGGCDGARQRFEPERSWDDNINLDKARGLLWPIKQKYGLGLSWGDLIILAGTTAVESMGGPILGFCAGRVDDADGEWSLELGPTEEQRAVAPCETNGECEEPLGTTTIGLIYLNPEGPMNQPIPDQSALEVRDTFGRMAMNDSETVALIGGGHAFGKTHGACPAGVGPSPREDPDTETPWAGLCGTGVGADAYTSGFEGPWTTEPTKWDNSYFLNLLNNDWEVVYPGQGGKHQWAVANGTSPSAAAPDGNGTQNIMMMTSDISLISDPTGEYQKLVQAYADDAALFDDAFAHAWYKLTTRDMGPVSRCAGADVPPAQPFQYPLPAPPAAPANESDVRAALAAALATVDPAVPADAGADGAETYANLFVRLAWQCASSFRVSDYLGGCNGARVRLSPMADWEQNVGLDAALALLAPVKDQFGDDALSWADLIVLAGTVALEQAGAPSMPFCAGRADALDGDLGAEYLADDVITGAHGETADTLKASIKLMGLTNREYVAIAGSGLGRRGAAFSAASGFIGTLTDAAGVAAPALSSDYFVAVLGSSWVEFENDEGRTQYYATASNGKQLYAMRNDVLLKYDSELAAIAQDFASDEVLFLGELAAAWTKLVNLDRFDGSTGSVCA